MNRNKPHRHIGSIAPLAHPEGQACSGCTYTLWSDQQANPRITTIGVEGETSVRLVRRSTATARELALSAIAFRLCCAYSSTHMGCVARAPLFDLAVARIGAG